MKRKGFPVLLGVLVFLSVVLFILYGVLPAEADTNGYWHSFSLGLAITFLLVALFLLFYAMLLREKPLDVHKGVICPHCGTIYPKDDERCPKCGEKNPEYREKKD